MEDENDREILRQLSARAILEFEDVKGKYKEYFEKFSKEESKRKRIESQFKQLKQVSLLAVAEYESLHKQYVEENKYRTEIEQKLKKVVEENQEIRKKGKLGTNTTIVPANNVSGAGAQGTKGELEVLRSLKDAVNAELRNTKNELNETKILFQQEKSAHEITLKRFNAGVQQLNQLNRVSVLAIDEFNVLRRKYETETTCRKKAEDVATELVAQQTLNERKSRIINEDEETQLLKYMEEIEAINAKAEKEKKEFEDKIKELEEKLEESQDDHALKTLEEKLSLVMDQLELSQKQLVDAEERSEKCQNEARNYCSRLALAERALDSTRSGFIPPPPPPPPPPIAAPVIRKLIFKIGKRKKGIDGGATVEDDPVATAMADMIDRIKKGVKLRPVGNNNADANNEQENGAIGQLTGLLTNLRQRQASGGELIDSTEAEKKVPEFAQFKLKKANTQSSTLSRADDGPSNELKKKLERQKSVADGIENTSIEKDATKQDDNTEVKKDESSVAQEDLIIGTGNPADNAKAEGAEEKAAVHQKEGKSQEQESQNESKKEESAASTNENENNSCDSNISIVQDTPSNEGDTKSAETTEPPLYEVVGGH